MNTARSLSLSPSAPEESAERNACAVVPIGGAARAEALRFAMAETNTSGRSLAAKMGVDERVVRNLLARIQPVTDARIETFPPRLRAAFEHALMFSPRPPTWSDVAVQMPLF